MKIVIDARFLGPEGTGVGRYVQKLVENLEQIDQLNDYVILLRSQNFELYQPTTARFKKVLVEAHWFTFKEQMLLPKVLKEIKPDLVHFPQYNVPIFYRGQFVATVHDLIQDEFVTNPKANMISIIIKKMGYRLAISKAINSSDQIIVPSNTVKEKVVARFGIDNEKVSVTYEAADEKFFEWGEQVISPARSKEILGKYGIKQPFIIYVGNSYPYKNLDRLLECLKMLPKNISLVNPCARSKSYDNLAGKVQALGLTDRVVLPGFVPDEDLAVLYHLAEVYVFPTLSEGFGIPVLEAMASKLPVVCSNIPILREVCGDNAIYFDPHDVQDIASKIAQTLNDKKLKERMIREGLERAKQFSWRKMAAQTLQVYQGSAR